MKRLDTLEKSYAKYGEQGARFLDIANDYRHEIITRHRWNTGRSSRPIRIGRATLRGSFVDGKWVWRRVG